MVSKFLVRYIFLQPKEYNVFLGKVLQKGSVVVFVNSLNLWHSESILKKIKSIIMLQWQPLEKTLQETARKILDKSIFGYSSDYNEGLYKINVWHNSQKWNLQSLTNSDIEKAKGLLASTVLIRIKHRAMTSNYLHLNLAEKAVDICLLLHPMVVKVPVTSIQYYVDIHSDYTFNEIRKANLDAADEMISYIYDLQFIQQKIALSLYELLYLIDYAEKQKGVSILISAEVSAITTAEVILTYLKSSIEKLIVLIGLIFGIKNLETKRSHVSKIKALESNIPEGIKQLYYYSFILEFIKSESIEKLNNYRTGILHKKGISDLQPHNYEDKNAAQTPLKDIFSFMIEQHSKNSAVIIAVYALLTDELIKRSPPLIEPEDLPY